MFLTRAQSFCLTWIKKLYLKLTLEKFLLPVLISPGQTIHVDRGFIGESGRLASDINDVCDIEKLSLYLMTIDFEKAFNSINHTLLIAALKKYGFCDNFIDCIKIL